WPLGDGPEFRGVFDRQASQVHLFERTPGGAYQAPVNVRDIHDQTVRDTIAPDVYERVCHELELLDGAGADFDLQGVRTGKLSPVFFGSAANNFGVQLLLDRFLELAMPPGPRRVGDTLVDPVSPSFSGFVFKIQANMNPRHRDHVAFIRIVSGAFQRDMNVLNPRTGKSVRLANSQRLFAQERETIDTAWAGDVVGIVGNYDFMIGDTLTEREGIVFDEIPRFPPECFAFLHNPSTAKFKRFREGLDQLLKEGLAQSFELTGAGQRVPLLGAVGPLQFEVLKYRLETEYAADCRVEQASWTLARWLRLKSGAPVREEPPLPTGAVFCRDIMGAPVGLFQTAWSVNYFEDNNRDWETSLVPFAG
ncbi:MAG: EF-Tu/IF-2/RF-3 family GTPase, partial [Verrucomicrobiae bacterium]|nr:EF-Tu/IF-2/RF-3 family GTPase [Verrucomicrobiae bacterium]